MAQRVAVLGGGVAGMTAAHELVERGFDVAVYEGGRVPGGKARSFRTPDDLPGEHGFRFFASFYRHLEDTLSRIPKASGGWVVDDLVAASRSAWAPFDAPLVEVAVRFPRTLTELRLFLLTLSSSGGPFALTSGEKKLLLQRIWQVITSCDERLFGEYEDTSWWDFVEADQQGAGFQKLVAGSSRAYAAADPKRTSARTIGRLRVQGLLGLLRPGRSFVRVLNAPTNEAWIDPWLSYLRSRRVAYHAESRVRSIRCPHARVDSVEVTSAEARGREVTADYYVIALPIEDIAALVTPELVAADPGLGRLRNLAGCVRWMSGIQFYLSEEAPITHGMVWCIDSPWVLSAVAQKQFWPSVPLRNRAGVTLRECLSAVISEWDVPGALVKKPAKECSETEIKEEVWHQLMGIRGLDGRPIFRKSMLVSWSLDPSIEKDPQTGRVVGNSEPLFVNRKGTWQLRPDSVTRIPNLFLAGDYVRTNTDLATMESANESARRAVNGILAVSGSTSPRCRLFALDVPVPLAMLLLLGWRRRHDRRRYKTGLAWNGRLLGRR